MMFPIKESFVSTLSKTDVKTFVLNLLCGLYSKKFLTLHKMINTSAKIGSELKIPIKTTHLAKIYSKLFLSKLIIAYAEKKTMSLCLSLWISEVRLGWIRLD